MFASDDRRPLICSAHFRAPAFTMALLAFFSPFVSADDAEIAKLLKAKDVEVTETKGVVTTVAVKDGPKLTDDDFRQICRLTNLKSVSLNLCLTDERLAQLSTLASLENLGTNGAQVTDEGLKPMAQLKNLRNVSFFHPGKSFSGAGLAYLADLPNLERLTVAGSPAFNDDGMTAVAKLTNLREFRTWHAGSTDEGVKKLRELKNLKSLHLGQRLSYKPPVSPADATIALLSDIKSLESLQIDETRLSFDALQQLKQLPSLKKLKLGGVEISKDDVDRLKKELPKVNIEWAEPSEVYLKRIHALFGGK